MSLKERILSYYSPTLEKIALAFSITFAAFLLMKVLNLQGIANGYGFPLPVESKVHWMFTGTNESELQISLIRTFLDTLFWYILSSPILTEVRK